MKIVLASSSPRRQQLLGAAGIPFTVAVADINEDPLPGESAQAMVERLAREKAQTVWSRLGTPVNTAVLAADTTVVVDEHILAKPESPEDAVRMLKLMSNRSHDVLTGVCLLGNNGDQQFEDTRCETTLVYFNPMSDSEMRAYVASGEPMDKAGAYGIQGIAARWIPRVEGCFFNVMGLPLSLVYRMLRQHRIM